MFSFVKSTLNIWTISSHHCENLVVASTEGKQVAFLKRTLLSRRSLLDAIVISSFLCLVDLFGWFGSGRTSLARQHAGHERKEILRFPISGDWKRPWCDVGGTRFLDRCNERFSLWFPAQMHDSFGSNIGTQHAPTPMTPYVLNLWKNRKCSSLLLALTSQVQMRFQTSWVEACKVKDRFNGPKDKHCAWKARFGNYSI